MASRKSPKQSKPSTRVEKQERPSVIGARVRELYEAKGWTQFDLAWASNISSAKLSRIILEQQGLGVDLLVRLAICLETSTDYLVGLTDEKKPPTR